MTDFRASGTIMGPAGLTAVFGMGTGGAPQVSSPERVTASGQARGHRLARDQAGFVVSHRTHRQAIISFLSSSKQAVQSRTSRRTTRNHVRTDLSRDAGWIVTVE